MADAVTSQTLLDGYRNVVMKFTNLSDGTGESAVKKVDVTALTPAAGTKLKVMKIRYSIEAGSVSLLWEATSNVTMVILRGYGEIKIPGGIVNNGGSGVTGSILLTTNNFISQSSYTIELEMVKGI